MQRMGFPGPSLRLLLLLKKKKKFANHRDYGDIIHITPIIGLMIIVIILIIINNNNDLLHSYILFI